MAEAEDVVQDVARYATIHIRRVWLRHRGSATAPRPLSLPEVRQRIDLLIHAVYGVSLPVRVAQVPAHPTLLTRLFRRHDVRQSGLAIPATDGRAIWLPMELPLPSLAPDASTEHHARHQQYAAELFRTIALLQASRASRGSCDWVRHATCPRTLALYTLLEARAADEHVIRELPGMAQSILRLRRWALNGRPAIAAIPPACRPIETVAQDILAAPLGEPIYGLPDPPSDDPREHLEIAGWLLRRKSDDSTPSPHKQALFKDCWTGELLPVAHLPPQSPLPNNPDATDADTPARSARLPRSPKARQNNENDDKKKDGTWMIHTGEPLEKAEDPMGTQRPADRDEETAADEFADALSELPEARLVTTSSPTKEVLLSDDTPEHRHQAQTGKPDLEGTRIHYPEWDYRINGYHHPGATVHLLPSQHGPELWVEKTLERHRGMLDTIRRRFEMLQAERIWLRRRLDGDEIDIDAYTEARCDVRSGLPMPQALYRHQRRQARNIAIVLLVDISGSTDSYLTDMRRIIDVEREALLLVAIALQHMGEPYSIQAFSGDGPHRVTLNILKHFHEPHSHDVALRIAALEPQYYTRTGAAMRHATAELMQQPAEHRLLLLLSDGKPNDADVYEGRYGVEDTRRAVEEARIQGVHPFCLTIDRQAARYLPNIFGHGHYALLSRPQDLPAVLLDWMRRLVAGT